MSERENGRVGGDAAVRRWIEGYVRAWRSNDAGDIRALFAEDAEYRTDPWVEPWRGADAIVAAWIARGDEQHTWEFSWDVAGVDGDRGFVQGVTTYANGTVYSNLWVIDLAADGRAHRFVEWWMDQASPS